MATDSPSDPPVNIHLLDHAQRLRQLGPCWRALMDSPGDQTTPRRLNGSVGTFIRSIATGGQTAHRVPVERWGRLFHCHVNARLYAQEHGLRHQFGWVIWQGSNYIEAEPHSVVQLPDGSFKCVTANLDGEEELVFLPDPTRDLSLQEYAGDPDLWLVSGFHNVPAKDPRIFEYRWLTPKADLVAIKKW